MTKDEADAAGGNGTARTQEGDGVVAIVSCATVKVASTMKAALCRSRSEFFFFFFLTS